MHTCFQKSFLMSKNSCKEYFVEQKTNQVDNSHQLQTSNVWQQNIDIYTQSQHA